MADVKDVLARTADIVEAEWHADGYWWDRGNGLCVEGCLAKAMEIDGYKMMNTHEGGKVFTDFMISEPRLELGNIVGHPTLWVWNDNVARGMTRAEVAAKIRSGIGG